MSNKFTVKIVTGKVRLGYVHVFEKYRYPNEPAGSERFSVSVLIPKTDVNTINKINAAVEQVIQENMAYLSGGKPLNRALLQLPLRDGDTDPYKVDDPVYKGCMFINPKSDRQPGVVDINKQAILNPQEVYSGVYGRASFTLFPYVANGKIGVGVGLNHIMSFGYGDAFSGGTSAEVDFDDDFVDDGLAAAPGSAYGFSQQPQQPQAPAYQPQQPSAPAQPAYQPQPSAPAQPAYQPQQPQAPAYQPQQPSAPAPQQPQAPAYPPQQPVAPAPQQPQAPAQAPASPAAPQWTPF